MAGTNASGQSAGGSVWILAEQEGGRLRPVSYELLSWGRRLRDAMRASARPGAQLCSVALGGELERADLRELIERGADAVYYVEAPELEHFTAEPYSNALEHMIRRFAPEVVIAAATSTGRTLMPHVAARIPTGLTADCTGLDIDPQSGNLVQTRPAAGGNVLATIVTERHRPQMATVRPHSAAAPPRLPGRRGELVRVEVPAELLENPVQWLGLRSQREDGIEIRDADRIVSGGRGLGRGENFALLRRLAEALGAAVGASREAVERGWISYPHQVGLSGKTVSPRLYVAVGISGAIQHLAGMRTSECIVAVNNDPDAQIFQVSDLAVVGDLFEFVPALVEELERRRAVKQEKS